MLPPLLRAEDLGLHRLQFIQYLGIVPIDPAGFFFAVPLVQSPITVLGLTIRSAVLVETLLRWSFSLHHAMRQTHRRLGLRIRSTRAIISLMPACHGGHSRSSTYSENLVDPAKKLFVPLCQLLFLVGPREVCF